MPYLNVKLIKEKDEDLARKVAESLTNLTNSILNKKRELTAVSVDFSDPSLWFVNGNNLGKSTYYVNIKITEGTNTKVEKENYLKSVHDAMAELLNDAIEEASYIVIDEVKADAWGYSGKTQEFRHVKSRGLL